MSVRTELSRHLSPIRRQVLGLHRLLGRHCRRCRQEITFGRSRSRVGWRTQPRSCSQLGCVHDGWARSWLPRRCLWRCYIAYHSCGQPSEAASLECRRWTKWDGRAAPVFPLIDAAMANTAGHLGWIHNCRAWWSLCSWPRACGPAAPHGRVEAPL